jgi:hypothetical protein
VTAVALFGGAMLRDWRLALIVPLSAMWFSDLVLNNLIYQHYFDGFVWWHSDLAWTYGAMALTVVLGRGLLSGRIGVVRVAGVSVTASTLFFVLTNFGVWATGLLYPLTAGGLLALQRRAAGQRPWAAQFSPDSLGLQRCLMFFLPGQSVRCGFASHSVYA